MAPEINLVRDKRSSLLGLKKQNSFNIECRRSLFIKLFFSLKKPFSLSLTFEQDKLECFSLANLSGPV
jgi:hypothetical protein